MGGAPTLKLGLIGDNIAASRAPDLHRIAGRLNNMDVQYDRLIPKEMNQTFDQIFESCPDNGYQALNITYPYKEHVVSQVTIDDPMVRAIAAVTTVVFDGTSSRPTIPTTPALSRPMNRCAQTRNRVSAVCLGQGALGAPWPLGWSSWVPMKFAYLIVTAPKRSS